jgi:hypothetical protein
MKLQFFPDRDKHLYLVWSLTLLGIAIAIFVLDKNLSRAFSVAGGVINLAGVYWVAAGVVLHTSDVSDLTRASLSGGMKYIGRDPIKEIIPNMLKIQSLRAKVGVFYVFIGSCCQFIGVYVA